MKSSKRVNCILQPWSIVHVIFSLIGESICMKQNLKLLNFQSNKKLEVNNFKQKLRKKMLSRIILHLSPQLNLKQNYVKVVKFCLFEQFEKIYRTLTSKLANIVQNFSNLHSFIRTDGRLSTPLVCLFGCSISTDYLLLWKFKSFNYFSHPDSLTSWREHVVNSSSMLKG